MEESDENFVKCLSIPPNARKISDIQCIRSYLKTIEALKSFKELTISDFSRIARYECYQPNSILYRRNDVCTSWYIVLSGCVLVDQKMFFPRTSFGHRSQGNVHRFTECVIVEKTELIVFDYSMETYTQPTTMTRKSSTTTGSIKGIEILNNSTTTLMTPIMNHSYNNGLVSNRSSHASDTSSAYSGCDILSANSCGNASFASDNEDDDADLDSLSQEICSTNDTFYDVILKDPNNRTEADIETMLDGVQNLPAFLNFTSKTKYELCKVMRAAVVQNSGEKLMDDGQTLDTWNVVINGSVEVRFNDGSLLEYNRGDSFGVAPTMNEQKQVGEIWTVSPTCLFCCVLQNDFCDIISRNAECITSETKDNGKIDLVYEDRQLSSNSSKTVKVVVKGTVEKLMNIFTIDQHKNDPMFIENFLLTYRVFIKSPKIIAEKLCETYRAELSDVDTSTKATIRKSLILWANNHFVDLDDPNSDMAEYLEHFENIFSDGRFSCRDRSLFFLACSNNSKPRVITIDVEKHVPFRLIGLQKGWGLFIKEVSRLTNKKTFGLRRGDQILSLANHSWERIETLDKATDMLNTYVNCSIELIVRYNPSVFHEILDYLNDCESGIEYDSPRSASLAMSNSVTLHGLSDHVRNGLNSVITPMAIPRPHDFIPNSPPTRSKNPRSANTSPTRQNIRHKSKNKYSPTVERDKKDAYANNASDQGSLNNRSTSNPDLKAQEDNYGDSISRETSSTIYQVLKVFRPNTTDNKLVLITNNTTAKEVVPLIMKEYSLDLSDVANYSLYMVTVENGPNGPLVKSSRVALYFKDLAGKLALNQRYYLKNNQTDNQLITDEQVKVLLNDSKVTLSQLSPLDIATRLTLIDYALFRDIQAAEYINFIFKLPPLDEGFRSLDSNNCLQNTTNSIEGFSNGYENYKKFEDLINRESFWPTTEICSEPNVNKRAELIKKFIKVAKICKDLKNFNSLMCIITGLTLTPVSRLKSTWDKVPNKYIKTYEDLSYLTDMSFNFRRIRQLVSPEVSEPPLIPCLALHSKDLAAIHLGNKTSTKDGLINFEKLRMMATEIRKLIRMCNTEYNLQSILSSVKNRNSPKLNALPSPNFNYSMDESDATSGISGCSNNSDNIAKKGRSNSVDQFALNRTLKKKNVKRKSITMPDTASSKNSRKVYEEWLATLKFRTYLTNLQVEMNITNLQDLSQSLEPSQLIVSPQISSSSPMVTTPENQSTDQTVTTSHSNSPKPSVTMNQTKPNMSAVITTATSIIISPSSPQSVTSNNSKPRGRPQSIFSYQTQDEITKIMELASSTKKVPRKSHLNAQDNTSNSKMPYANPGMDHNILLTLPIYNNELRQELTLKTQARKERINSNFIPGGITLNLQQNSSNHVDPTKSYYYPTAGIPLNNVYYTGDKRKGSKLDLPSYETARAISHHQKHIQIPNPNTSRPTIYSANIGVNNEINTSKPPLCSNKPPKLPTYDQHLSRSNVPNQNIIIQPAIRGLIQPPAPPPRTVTMQQSHSNCPNINKINNNKEFAKKRFQSLDEFGEVFQF